jgi:hypothetical protein
MQYITVMQIPDVFSGVGLKELVHEVHKMNA